MKSAIFNFGRFNPPTKGHLRLIITTKHNAIDGQSDYFLFPSRSVDKIPMTKPLEPSKCKNPLSFTTKYAFLTELLPLVNIVDNASVVSPHQVIDYLSELGYEDVTFAVGTDRVEEFNRRWLPYAEQVFVKAFVAEAAPRDNSNRVSRMSGTKARSAALDGNLEYFQTVTGWHNNFGVRLYNAVRTGMGLDGRTRQSIQGEIIGG